MRGEARAPEPMQQGSTVPNGASRMPLIIVSIPISDEDPRELNHATILTGEIPISYAGYSSKLDIHIGQR